MRPFNIIFLAPMFYERFIEHRITKESAATKNFQFQSTILAFCYFSDFPATMIRR